jgi:hypothetical protein
VGVACGVGGVVLIAVVISGIFYVFCGMLCCYKVTKTIMPKEVQPKEDDENTLRELIPELSIIKVTPRPEPDQIKVPYSNEP